MAQADGVVANGTGAAVRSDLNGQLAALFTNHSGSTEPSTTYAYQFWADTNANVLKIRNSANNAWITLRELDGTMLIEDGSAASPGLAFADDTNTGIFSGGADQVGLSTNGVERFNVGTGSVIINDPGNDVDFRVESDGQTHMLFVDGGNNRVGIGTSSPGRTLTVADTTNSVVLIEGSTSGTSNLFLGDSDDEDIGAITYNHASNFLSFTANADERARIDSSGRLLFGHSSSRSSANASEPHFQMEGINVSTSTLAIVRNENAVNGPILALSKSRGTSTGSNTVVQSGDITGAIHFAGADGTDLNSFTAWIQSEVDGTPGGNDMPGRLAFYTTADGANSPTERLRIDSAGRFFFNENSSDLGHKYILSGNEDADVAAFQYNSNTGTYLAISCGAPNGVVELKADARSGTFPALTFKTGNTERTRIDKDGRFLHGLTSPSSTAAKFEVAANVGPDPAYQFTQTASSGLSYDLVLKKSNYAPDDNSSRFLTCADSSADRLHIKSDGDVLNHDNSYGSLSDVSLKQQIVDASSQWDDIKDVRVRKFKMNSDVEAYGDEAGFRIGVIAQELEQTSPGLVKDNAEPDGTILKSVSYSVLYMKAIKALQEAQTRIEALETKVAALEAG